MWASRPTAYPRHCNLFAVNAGGRASAGTTRGALAAAILVGASVLSASAHAEDAGEIQRRIAALFDLVAELEQGGAAAPATEPASEATAGPEANSPPPVLATAVPFAAPTAAPIAATPAPVVPQHTIEIARLPRPRPDAPEITGSVDPLAEGEPDAPAQEEAFFSRFAGTFTGSGAVKRNAREEANQVSCKLTGQTSATGISMSGKCGAFIFTKQIEADIRYDPATGRYSGTYVGSRIGPAKLSGRRSGDIVVLQITWPKRVNGDTTAIMTIRNSGDGNLSITVTDDVYPGGPKVEVTRLALIQA